MSPSPIKSSHKLWKRWLVLRRRAVLVPEWRADFWAFVRGVGEPGESKKLARPDGAQPYGPANFYWSTPLTAERKVAYHRDYNAKNAEAARESLFQRKYGIGIADYDARLLAQGGGCAICGAKEGEATRRGGDRLKRLAVDHDHETGQVRGLLCTDCNVGIGLLGDSPTRMFAAIQYLGRFKVAKVS